MIVNRFDLNDGLAGSVTGSKDRFDARLTLGVWNRL